MADPDKQSEEYERFEELARKFARIPKKKWTRTKSSYEARTGG